MSGSPLVALRECPFCGGDASPVQRIAGEGRTRWSIYCATAYCATMTRRARKDVIANWNLRKPAADALERAEADSARLDWLELIIRDGSYQTFIHDIAAICLHSYKHFGNGPAIRTAIDGLREQTK